MADLTQVAVDSLVGLLLTAVTEEAKLLGGLHGDMQFIKDEMESINGFLIHLTKTERMHDDQLRAWMKQVRDISYIAQDCIELYRRDFMPPSSGFFARFYYRMVLLVTCRSCKEHDLASRIRDLKARVKDVGERRERYQVSIPMLKEEEGTRPAEVQASQDKIDEAREEFVRALARDKEKQRKKNEAIGLVTQFVRALARDKEQKKELVPCFDEAIRLLVKDLQSAAIKVRDCLRKNLPHEESAAVCMEMLLRALWGHSHVRLAVQKTKKEVMKLVDEADTDIQDFPTQVMIFCYSKLSRSYKSCLQYLYAFHDEAAISRTSLVRRWLAEGRVEKKAGFDGSLDEAAELCFKDLLFRGFLLPVDDPTTAASKVKRCIIEDTVWNFVYRMSTTENFVDSLPTHLGYQLRIRIFVKRLEKYHPRPQHRWSICGRWTTPPDDITAADPHPMDDLVNFLKSLGQGYRLNVLDLGGCKGLKKRHLNSICNVVALKYLSLRNTDVSHLPEEINHLILLETLDIRQTKVRAPDMKDIYLRKLKHLLTSPTTKEETLHWAWMPRKIGEMEDMEILSRVQVRQGKKELEEVGRLLKLRKLGVVLAGSQSQAQDSMDNLLQAIAKLRECLRSLSIWVTPPPTDGDPSVTMNMVMIQDYAPQLLESLDIRGVRFLNTGLPHWIWALQNLSDITLCDTFLSKVSLQDLGNKLHCLRRLRLRHNSYSEPNLTFNKDGVNAELLSRSSYITWIKSQYNWRIRFHSREKEDATSHSHLILSRRGRSRSFRPPPPHPFLSYRYKATGYWTHSGPATRAGACLFLLGLARRSLAAASCSVTPIAGSLLLTDGFQDLRFLIVEGNTITTVTIEQGGAAPLLKKIVWHNIAINQAGKLSGIHHLKRLQEVVLKGNFTDPRSSPLPHNDGCKLTEA